MQFRIKKCVKEGKQHQKGKKMGVENGENKRINVQGDQCKTEFFGTLYVLIIILES